MGIEDILKFAVPGVGILLLIIIIVVGYVKASPDEAVIISGVKRTPRIIRGRASVMIPFFERKEER